MYKYTATFFFFFFSVVNYDSADLNGLQLDIGSIS